MLKSLMAALALIAAAGSGFFRETGRRPSRHDGGDDLETIVAGR